MKSRPVFLKTRSSTWFILVVVSFADAVDIFMYSMIAPVTPTALRDRVGVAPDDIQIWASTLLALFAASLLAAAPVVGYISDRCQSRRWPFVVGLVALAMSTGMLCIGTHLWLWVLGRLCQGASAAAVWVVGVALVVDTVGQENAAKAIGCVALASSFGLLSGPLIGGMLYEMGGYYAVFGVAFGLIGVDMVLRLVMIEKKDARKYLDAAARLAGDEPQRVLEPGKCPNTELEPKYSFSDKARALLGSRRLIVNIWANFTISVVITSLETVLPLFVLDKFGWSQSGQGFIFAPLVVPHVLGPLSGYVVDRWPGIIRYLVGVAFGLSGIPLILFLFVKDDTIEHKVLLCVLLIFIGICIAVALPPVDAEAFLVVDQLEKKIPGIFGPGGAGATAFGITSTGFAAGGLVGPFFAGSIRQAAGWGVLGTSLALFTSSTGLWVLLFMGNGSIFGKPDKVGRRSYA